MFGFAALEGKGNIGIIQVQLQPPHLIMVLVEKKYPHGNEPL